MSYIMQTSAANGGSATAPAAGTSIATLGVLAAGTYQVIVLTVTNGGTPVAADLVNQGLYSKGALVAALPLASGGPMTFTVAADGTNPVKVAAIASATASVVYGATLTATLLTGN